MGTKKNLIASLGVLAGLTVLSATSAALALPVDEAKILIDRALNSPTLTIRFSGVSASMVELKVNGTSFGTRAVDAKNKRGETNFTLDPSLLSEGDNEIEVRLFDKEGRLLGSEKSIVSTDVSDRGPVYLVQPKVGATVMGPMEIKVGFGREMRNSYVSFFINGQFRSMTNVAPFAFIWDTSREANGWHEVEAWVVDDSSNTFKTRKVKVFVNNPGGRTPRNPEPKPEPKTAVVEPKPAVANPNPTKVNTGTSAAVTTAIAVAPVAAATQAVNDVKPITAPRATLKTMDGGQAVSMGTRNITPSIAKATPQPTSTIKSVIDVKVSNPKATGITSAATMSTGRVSIAKGQRLPNIGTFTIVLNSAPVAFDVQPRVQDGIALTPFRALFEQAGGTVDWENLSKALSANGMGKDVMIKIGDRTALVNKISVSMELAPFIERGRTIVPLSFIRESLDVEVDYDPATGHVLITKKKG